MSTSSLRTVKVLQGSCLTPGPRATLPLVKLLLVEDDAAIAIPLVSGLRKLGFEVDHVTTGAAALDAPEPDVLLLDLGLPDVDGIEVCRTWRARSQVPIIVVTARGEETDRVVGLELGADDYVTKPFGFRELVARIRAVSRRAGPRAVEGPQEVGALSLDRRTRRVRVGGDLLALTPKEFDVLALLIEEPGVVVTRRQIIERVWDTTWYGPSRSLDVHIASLRRKLGAPGWIETVRGVGFRLVAPV